MIIIPILIIISFVFFKLLSQCSMDMTMASVALNGVHLNVRMDGSWLLSLLSKINNYTEQLFTQGEVNIFRILTEM